MVKTVVGAKMGAGCKGILRLFEWRCLGLGSEEMGMSAEVWGMTITGIVTLAAGLVLVRERFQAASGGAKVVVLGPVFEAVSLAIFSAEHFFAARELMAIVPRWLPGPLFWTYFVGAAWLAAAISFIAWRQVRWSATLTAALLLIIVITVDLPNTPKNLHSRFFWILIVRETAFASGAMVLAGSAWLASKNSAGNVLIQIGRFIVAGTMIFYAVEHFLFPRFVPGVPLAKLTPAWIPAPGLISTVVGISLLVAGVGLLIPRTSRMAAAGSGTVLVLLTVFFYVPILATEFRSPLAVEGLNYVGDTLLWAATVLLAGFGADLARMAQPVEEPVRSVA